MIKKIINLIKRIPVLRHILERIKKLQNEKEIISKLKNNSSIKIVLGAEGKYDDGWIPTDIQNLNMLESHDWKKFFSPNSIDAMLSEHVLEHLTEEQAYIALKHSHEYLKQGGYFRIAVPDGNHPEQSYIDYVKVNGSGPGSDDHKVLYTYDSLKKLLEKAGFEVNPLEYFDDDGNFHFYDWSVEQGTIKRSKRYDERNKDKALTYTSIIVDAVKK